MLSFALLGLPVAAALATPWAQPRDSPVHELFKRADHSADYNSASWQAQFPPYFVSPNETNIPQAWLDKLKSVKLPEGNPPSVLQGCCTPRYDKDGNDPSICSFSAGCHTAEDIFAGPDGVFVLTFDDGPGEASMGVYNYLTQNKISNAATHFMIGGNIVGDPVTANVAFKNGGHIAVHTWSHHYTTNLTDAQVVGELGWTMQAISDVTGGRIPLFWRPPYGDVDNRVRAIAKEVFGMETVLWNRDTNDWKIGSDETVTVESVKTEMENWFTGPKSPGVVALEHEINNNSLEVFAAAYPHMAENGWQVKSVADAFGMNWYQNARTNEGELLATLVVGEVNTAIYASQSFASPTASASASSSDSDAVPSGNASNPGGGHLANNGSNPVASDKASAATSTATIPLAAVVLAVAAAVAL